MGGVCSSYGVSVYFLMSNFKQEALGLQQDLRQRPLKGQRPEVVPASAGSPPDSKGNWTAHLVHLVHGPGASAVPGRRPCLEAMPAVPHLSPQMEHRAPARFPSGLIPRE